VSLGLALRGRATAAIDVSDGLAADLGHILASSGVGAEIELASLPLSPEVSETTGRTGDWGLPMASGDDYELCFTLPRALRERLAPIGAEAGCGLRVIGRITEAPGLTCLLPGGGVWLPASAGYDHFPGGGGAA
jgi:thiamine-monophosphate kinase